MNNQVLPAGSRVRVISYGPFRGLKGTIRKVDTIPGLEAGEAFCFYLVELEGMHIKEPIWFACDEVDNLVAHPVGFEVPKHALAFGTYRWPTMWHIHWQGSKGLAEASITLSTRKPLGNWVLAGFSMGIVSGKLSYDGQQIPLYGLAELFMM